MYIENRRTRYIALAIATVLTVSGILAIERPWEETGCAANDAGTPDFCDEPSWLNSEPLGLEGLEGKVVLVDFWTYTCINCIRTLPHLTELYDTYEPYGFVLVGVHTPEFAFEKERANVQEAIDKHGIRYPVVQDNDYEIWDNYHNRFWPTHYLIDPSGEIVDTHIGEGGYAETEKMVRELLVANGATDLPPAFESGGRGQRGTDITPELYAGYWRQPEAVGNEEGYQPDQDVEYTFPQQIQRDRIYFDGTWHNGREAMVARGDASFQLWFKAGAVNMVVKPNEASGTCAPVLLDGEPIPAELAGGDVRFDRDQPCILLSEEDSYDIYAGPVEEHVLTITVADGFALYTFAFNAFPGR